MHLSCEPACPRLRWTILVLLIVALLPLAAEASEDEGRPRIGLVLSGGGARGVAHIGVIRELERRNIPIDVVVGTSMGAIIGGLYASGMNADQIEIAYRSIDWDDVLSDTTPRRELSMRRKQEQAIFQVDKHIGITNKGLEAPSGLITGQKLELTLQDLLLPVTDVDDFDRLAIPFRAIATDIATSEMVVMGKGSLPMALRASMAVPGVFTPVEIDGRLLVDGGISNNLPVDVARRMGADIIIAVNISTPLKKQEEIKTVVDIADQLTNFMVYSSTHRQIESLGGQDILIEPDLEGYTSHDFGAALALIDIGAKAAQAQSDRLVVLERPVVAKEDEADAGPGTVPVIGFIEVDNDSRIDDVVLREKLHQQIGEPLDLVQLMKDIRQIYGLGTFDRVQYQLEKQGKETGLKLVVRRKPWGPNYLQFGLMLSSDLVTENNALIRIGLNRMPVNRLNGEWRSILTFGREPGLDTELYQPLAAGSSWFVQPRAFAINNRFNIIENGQIIAETSVNRFGGSLALGKEFSNNGDARLGYRRYFGKTEIAIGDPELPSGTIHGGELFGSVRFDTLDDTFFPRHGARGRLSLLGSRESLGADQDFDQLSMELAGAMSWDRHTLLASIRLDGTVNGQAPVQNYFRLGGLFNLPGYLDNELSAQNVVLLRTGYLRESGKVLSMPFYLGGTIQYGNVIEDHSNVDLKDLQLACALFMGLDSLLGPVYLGYGVAESGSNSFYLLIGGLF